MAKFNSSYTGLIVLFLFLLTDAEKKHKIRHGRKTVDTPDIYTGGYTLRGLADKLNGSTFLLLSDMVEIDLLSDFSVNATLFLPTDEAFRKLSVEYMDDLMKNRLKLKNLLLYHIVHGLVDQSSLEDELTFLSYARKSVQDERALIRSTFYKYINPPVRLIGHAKLTGVTEMAMSGMIHVISSVLRQPFGNIRETLNNNTRFSEFVKFITKSDIMDLLSCTPNIPHTILAPNNKAFSKLSPEQKAELDSNEDLLKEVTSRHIIQLTFFSQGIIDGLKLKTLHGEPVLFHRYKDVTVSHNNSTAKCIEMDITATNGVIHEIDRLLL